MQAAPPCSANPRSKVTMQQKQQMFKVTLAFCVMHNMAIKQGLPLLEIQIAPRHLLAEPVPDAPNESTSIIIIICGLTTYN